jgi:hypothetical protein
MVVQLEIKEVAMHHAISNAVSPLAAVSTEPLRAWIRQAGRRLKTWLEARAAIAAEAALYQDLSRLSDTELERRGIPRGELHRCVFGGAPHGL